MDPRTRIHKTSNLHHNDRDSAVAAGDVQPPINGLRTEQRVRKGRKRRNSRTQKVPNRRRGMMPIGRISSAPTSVRARSHVATSGNAGRAAMVASNHRATSDVASRNARPASMTSCDGNRCRRDGNAPGRSRFPPSTRSRRNKPGRIHATSGRKGSQHAAVAAIRSSARNRVTIVEAVGARASARSLVKTGEAEATPSLASAARFAGRVVTMRRPSASKHRMPVTSVDVSSVAR